MLDVDPITRLIEIDAIKTLKAKYFRLLDQQRWDEWRDLFTEDLRFESPFSGVRIDGRDAFVERFRELRADGRSVHHGHMPEIELTAPDTASGVWALDDFVEEAPKDGVRSVFRGSGYYYEAYVKRDGRWLIASLRLERLRVDTLETWSQHLA